jgi:hypothetical protein
MFIIINGPTIFMPIHLASRILSLTHVHMSYIWFQLNNWSLPAANHLTFIHKDSNHKMQSKFDLRRSGKNFYYGLTERQKQDISPKCGRHNLYFCCKSRSITQESKKWFSFVCLLWFPTLCINFKWFPGKFQFSCTLNILLNLDNRKNYLTFVSYFRCNNILPPSWISTNRTSS